MSRLALPQVGLSVARSGRQVIPTLGRFLAGNSAGSGTSIILGVSNADGAWTEVISNIGSTEGHFVVVQITGAQTSGIATPMLLDIGIGANPSEAAIVSSFSMGQNTVSTVVFPVSTPPGSRLSIRIKTSVASVNNVAVRVQVFDRPQQCLWRAPSKLIELGGDRDNSLGTAVTTANTWFVVTASTTQVFQGVLLGAGANDGTLGASTDRVAVGVGASGAEVVLGSFDFNATATEAFQGIMLPVSHHIPAGSRVVVRSSGGTTNVLSPSVHGLPYT